MKFYNEVLGFKILQKLELPKDYGYMVEAAPGYEIWIAKHSKVHGKNKEPFRHIVNFYTPDVVAIFEKVRKVKGVKIIQRPMSMGKVVPGETRIVATILDPEGNCLQFMEPSEK